ncbi:hypothetical protein [Streptomyces sp. NPDC058855]|uniref:hypothetical protein n=1 Tax=Streptomyces sp. NPDC058855 TaxID=3346651 RepID=UPI003698E60E
MTKRPHEHDEYISGVRAELLGTAPADPPFPADHDDLPCPFCRTLSGHPGGRPVRRGGGRWWRAGEA